MFASAAKVYSELKSLIVFRQAASKIEDENGVLKLCQSIITNKTIQLDFFEKNGIVIGCRDVLKVF